MTLEFSLRRRAIHARCLAILWLSLTVAILVGTYLSLPIIASKTLSGSAKVDSSSSQAFGKELGNDSTRVAAPSQIFAMMTLVFGLFVILYACFILSRSALVEIELAARFNGQADALCIAGADFERLEKATNLLMPKTKSLSVPEVFSVKNIKTITDLMKQLR